jgi:hypothetical protein
MILKMDIAGLELDERCAAFVQKTDLDNRTFEAREIVGLEAVHIEKDPDRPKLVLIRSRWVERRISNDSGISSVQEDRR